MPQNWAFFFMYEGVMTGGPKRSLDTALACQSNDLVPILISNQENPIFEQARRNGIKTVVLNIPKTLWERRGQALSLNPVSVYQVLRGVSAVKRQVSSIIENERLSGWWSRGVKCVLMARGATRAKKIPLVWDIGSEYKSRGLVAGIHFLAFRSASKVVAQGQSVLTQTFSKSILKRFDHKICAMIPGLSDSRVERLSDIFECYDSTQPISVVGSVCGRKNQLELIKACTMLLQKKKDLRLRIVGDAPDENYLRECHSLTDAFPDAFMWHGWSDDIVKVLRDSSALVVASKSEGLPQVVLEAMHAGRPVISVPVGAVPDLIQDGKNGFLTDEISKVQLAVKIEDFLGCTTSRVQSIRETAKNTVQSVANHQNWRQSYADLLYRLGNTG